MKKVLTFYQASYHIERNNHSAHAYECLLAPPKEVEAVASTERNGKRPAAYDNIDLGLSSRVRNAGLIQDFVKVKSRSDQYSCIKTTMSNTHETMKLPKELIMTPNVQSINKRLRFAGVDIISLHGLC